MDGEDRHNMPLIGHNQNRSCVCVGNKQNILVEQTTVKRNNPLYFYLWINSTSGFLYYRNFLGAMARPGLTYVCK